MCCFIVFVFSLDNHNIILFDFSMNKVILCCLKRFHTSNRDSQIHTYYINPTFFMQWSYAIDLRECVLLYVTFHDTSETNKNINDYNI